MGREDLAASPKFAGQEARSKHVSELDQIVEEWTQGRSPEEVMKKLQEEGIAAGVVENGADLMEDPQLRHRNYFEHFPVSSLRAHGGPAQCPSIRWDEWTILSHCLPS